MQTKRRIGAAPAGLANTAALALAILGAFGAALPASATSITPMKEDELVKGAEFIFQGYVTRIDYRMSDLRTASDARLPHTFVTFQVERIVKGKLSEPSGLFTLRMMGGPDPAARRFLQVQGCPDFDLGERVILFVRRNQRSICPIVGWAQGRFRVAAGSLFSETGREVWLTLQNKLALGRKQDLEEARTHNRGGNVVAHIVDGPNQSETTAAQPSPQGTRLSVAGFLNRIAGLVSALHTPAELSALTAVKSAAADQPFYVSQPAATGDTAPQQ